MGDERAQPNWDAQKRFGRVCRRGENGEKVVRVARALGTTGKKDRKG